MTARELKRRIPRKSAIGIGLMGLMLVVASAFAVHDDEFQLDRNTADDDPPIGGAAFAANIWDWENFFVDPNVAETGAGNFPPGVIPANSGFTDVEFVEDWSLVDGVYQTSDPTTFTQSKDIENIGSTDGWRCKAANQVTNKGDITNTYVAVYEKNGKKILYFGMEKDQDSGSNNVGLWLLQDGTIACAGGGSGNGNAFTGTHRVDDIFLVSEFTNGGGVSNIKAYKWVADIDPKPNVTT
ncbi:MAG TPA: hypothetical protein VFX65_14440, partial [Candidatus Limnocylindrales bacterium]|nr:hypothetical protein [Candidatus Limnocylindrales bacterium]